MPTYDYKCNDCGNVFEEFHSITLNPHILCPKCGGHTRRLISGGAGIIFKGSGFYVNDYKQSNSNNPANKSNNIANDNTKSDTVKSDSVKSDAVKSNDSKTATSSDAK